MADASVAEVNAALLHWVSQQLAKAPDASAFDILGAPGVKELWDARFAKARVTADRGATVSRPFKMTKKTVMVTGCSGSVGRPVCKWLVNQGHAVLGFDAVAAPELDGVCRVVVGDICDASAVAAALAAAAMAGDGGVDVFIHLAAFPDIKDSEGRPVSFVDHLLEPNVKGLYVCAEAALQAGVGRLVLASSIQVVTGLTATADVDARPKPNLPALAGMPASRLPLCTADGVAPLHEYALTKVWAEALGEMYARVHRMSVVNARIGWFVRNETEAANMRAVEAGEVEYLPAGGGLSCFLSHDDAGRFYQACVESEPTPGECITSFVTSLPAAGQLPHLDIEPARYVLGYEPQDVFPAGLPFHAVLPG
jgi:nucleoside-diphosphate-sugar epimerase